MGVERRTSAWSARQRGQGMVEYALILVLIAVVCIAVIGVVGHQTQQVFTNISQGLGGGK